MPIIRIDDKGKKRSAGKKVAVAVSLGTIAGVIAFCCYDRDVGLLMGVISSSLGAVWSLLDQ
jgi:hypothetical protein